MTCREITTYDDQMTTYGMKRNINVHNDSYILGRPINYSRFMAEHANLVLVDILNELIMVFVLIVFCSPHKLVEVRSIQKLDCAFVW